MAVVSCFCYDFLTALALKDRKILNKEERMEIGQQHDGDSDSEDDAETNAKIERNKEFNRQEKMISDISKSSRKLRKEESNKMLIDLLSEQLRFE